MADKVVDFLLEDLKQILSCSDDFILAEKGEIISLYEQLKFIRGFLNDAQNVCNKHKDELDNLVERIREVACEALDLIDYAALIAIKQKKASKDQINYAANNQSNHQNFKKFAEKVKSIKKSVMDIDSKKLYGDIGSPKVGSVSSSSSPSVDDEEIMVGFVDARKSITERLVGEKKQLEVISLVGMAGIGKTMLARKLYNDPLILYHFDVRGWTCVSQSYRKKDLFLSILSSVVENADDMYSLSEQKLGEKLYKGLKRRRYLIVVDDIWNIEAWEDLRRSFPDDGNGSRIMLTTRQKNVAVQIKATNHPHLMSFLTQDESWDLLQKKVFRNGDCRCPPELIECGKRIAAKCQGLPLAIVVVGGLLSKTEKKQEWWEEVAESVRGSYIIADEAEQLMDILVLSYNHLPHRLKSCFIYFGAFPEDYEIPVRRLVSLWIAEAFVEQIEERSLEHLAEDYLVELIDRSLVMVSQRRSRSGVKKCRIHDTLRDLCLRKAEEWKFPQQIDWYGKVASPSTPILQEQLCFHSHGFHALSGKPCYPYVYTTFSYVPSSDKHIPRCPHTKVHIYKLLRVLNLWCVYLNNFPQEILELFHLRFLELHVHELDSLPSQISNLWNLEMLIIDKGEWGRVDMPCSFWNMVSLRHLFLSDAIKLEKPSVNDAYPPVLDSLQSISALPIVQSSEDTEFFLRRIPNLRKVRFYRGPDEWKTYSFPNLSNLIHLDTLKLIDNCWEAPQPSLPQPSSFPPNLKKMTLSGGHMVWKEISKLGKLPNLEVLKLRRNFFSGPLWETSDGEFLKLKYLKLSWMNLQLWITSTGHFPILQQLVVERCTDLKEIPSCLGDAPTLQIIQISWSRRSAMNSALKIQEEQHEMGNDGLNVFIYPPIGEEGIGDFSEEDYDEMTSCKHM